MAKIAKGRRSSTVALGLMFLGVASLMMGGCASHPSVSNVATGSLDRNAAGTQVEQPDWLTLNKKFAKILTVDQQYSRRVNDMLMVQVEVTNLKKYPAVFETMFEWLDESGMQIDDSTGHWAPRTIRGFGSQKIEAVSPSERVTSYRFLIRPSNE